MAEPALLDTNILVYALYEQSAHHHASRQLLARAEAHDAGFCITMQSVTEFYAVVTNPRRVTAAMDYAAALQAIETILALPGIILLPAPADMVSRWAALIREYPVVGQHVFDVQLIAAMLGNGVRRIYTFNTTDFTPFSRHIGIIKP